MAKGSATYHIEPRHNGYTIKYYTPKDDGSGDEEVDQVTTDSMVGIGVIIAKHYAQQANAPNPDLGQVSEQIHDTDTLTQLQHKLRHHLTNLRDKLWN